MTIQHPSVGPRPRLTLISGGAGPDGQAPSGPPTPPAPTVLDDVVASLTDDPTLDLPDASHDLACRAVLARLAQSIVAIHTNPIEGQQVVLATFDLEALPELAGLMYQGRREP